jgi:hypothetical protein
MKPSLPLGSRDKLLRALAEKYGVAPFSLTSAILTAWTAYPIEFGLRGKEKEHPDSAAVLRKFYGETGLLGKGFVCAHSIVRAHYQLTPKGLTFAKIPKEKHAEGEAPERLWIVLFRGKTDGPFAESVVVQRLLTGKYSADLMVHTRGLELWTPVDVFAPFAQALGVPVREGTSFLPEKLPDLAPRPVEQAPSAALAKPPAAPPVAPKPVVTRYPFLSPEPGPYRARDHKSKGADRGGRTG